MKKESIWVKDYKEKEKEKNKEKLENTDILIIGGGITGLTTAYFLKDDERKVTIIDKGKLGMGISSKTTAKINYLQKTIYQDLEKYYGIKVSKRYFDSQIDAIKLVENIVKLEHIDCNLERVDSFIYTTKKDNLYKLEKEKEILEGWDIKVKEIKNLPLKEVNILKGIGVSDTFVFHPIKYLLGLKKSLGKNTSLVENVCVQDISLQETGEYKIKTNHGDFLSNTVVVACHYPFFIKPGLFPLYSYLKREYVSSKKINHPSNFTAINIDNNLESIRFYKNYLIYGSYEQKLTGNTNYQNGYQKSEDNFKKVFKEEPEYTWMNQDLVMNDSVPWIGRITEKQKNLYIATGYQAWGMTNGTIAGKVISDLILGKENPYTTLFSPTRSRKPKVLPLLTNSLEYLKVYIETYFNKNPKFYDNQVRITKINGVDYGIYIDNKNEKHVVYNLCPHLKCKLVFNKEDLTWDCPCHGSRFSIDGDVIEGPATYSIRVKNNS